MTQTHRHSVKVTRSSSKKTGKQTRNENGVLESIPKFDENQGVSEKAGTLQMLCFTILFHVFSDDAPKTQLEQRIEAIMRRISHRR